MEYKKLLVPALKAALLGGKEILEVYSKDFSVITKEDNSPLTEADQKAHHIINEVLKQTTLPILSEEGKTIAYEIRKNWRQFWMVDPLDGTKEFIKKNGEFTVNIALVEEGNANMGIIFAPVLNTLYFGINGIGSYKIEADINFLLEQLEQEDAFESLIKICIKLPVINSDLAYTIVASRSHMSPETEKFIESLRLEKGKVEMISKGSSLKLCLVAEGSANVYPRFAPTMEWDTAAGQAIAIAAGYNVIDPNSNTQVIYNKENLLNPWFIVG